MSDLKKQYELWDEFLNVWPLARLSTMTLDEYTQAGSKDSFTYWIESRLDELGSIWGGSSFKFGVFSRKDTDDKTSDAKLSYSDTHGWYSSLGASAEEAFLQVRSHVAQVATLAAQGDLDGIEKFEHLGEAYKWKIAFHYQNRQSPVIVDIFKKAPLAVCTAADDSAERAVDRAEGATYIVVVDALNGVGRRRQLSVDVEAGAAAERICDALVRGEQLPPIDRIG